MPSHTSVVGETSPVHTDAPAWQISTPRPQVPHAPPNPAIGDSSTLPLQLSSMLLQVSAVAVPGVHVRAVPDTQFCCVRWHAPTPHVVLPRASSISPLQSSSMPLQISAV